MNDIRQIQLMLTDMLKVFHEFCELHSLKYYALYGTALGAARHQGFIPWDDDLDVGMPRPDYEKLIKIFNSENKNKRYVIETPYSPASDYVYPYSKMYDTSTTMKENMKHPIVRGLFIDIFPIDGCENNILKAIKFYKSIKKKVFLRDLRVYGISRKRTFYKNIVKLLVQLIPRFIMDEKKICINIDKECKRFNYDSSSIAASLLGAWGEKEIMPKAFWGQPQLLPFETIHIFCPQKLDEYLTNLYGDWRTPPPKEKRISSHDCNIDLSKSYLKSNMI